MIISGPIRSHGPSGLAGSLEMLVSDRICPSTVQDPAMAIRFKIDVHLPRQNGIIP
jgi:hypothetical protein